MNTIIKFMYGKTNPHIQRNELTYIYIDFFYNDIIMLKQYHQMYYIYVKCKNEFWLPLFHFQVSAATLTLMWKTI